MKNCCYFTAILVFHVNSSAVNLTVFIAVNFTAVLFKKRLNWDSNPGPLVQEARVKTTEPAGRQFGTLNILFKCKACHNSCLCPYSRVDSSR